MSLPPGVTGLRIDQAKLLYLLAHDAGKARFFASFGFNVGRRHELEAAIRAHPSVHPVESSTRSVHGVKYVYRCAV